jgi:glycogen synthase
VPVQLPLDVQQMLQQHQLEQQAMMEQQQQQTQDQQQPSQLLQQQRQPVSAAAADDVEAAADFHRRSEAGAAAASSSSSSSSRAGAGSSRGFEYARYYMSCSSGVDRVFVDHPLYNSASDGSTGSAGPWPAGVLTTYCHPEGTMSAAWGAPDLAAAASVLSQAALAAPVLLWGMGDKLDGQQQQQQQKQQQQQQQQQRQRRQLQKELAMLLQQLGLDNEQQPSLDPFGGLWGSLSGGSRSYSSFHSGGHPVSDVLASAARQREARLAVEMRHPQQVVCGVAQPVLMGTGGSEVDRRWAVCDLIMPRQQQQQQQQGDGPVIFVGNDWPCGVLPLWLRTCRAAAAAGDEGQAAPAVQQDQPDHSQSNLGQQQQQSFAAAEGQHNQQQQQQEEGVQRVVEQQQPQQLYADWLQQDDPQQQLEEVGVLCTAPQHEQGSAELRQSATQQHGFAVPHASSSSGSSTQLQGAEATGDVLHHAAAAAQLQQQDSRGHSTQPPPQHGTQQSATDTEDLQLHDSGSSSGSPDSNPAELPPAGAEPGVEIDAWLASAVGYSPDSVHDRQLTASVSAAIAAGRVPPERLPGLLAGQSQLALLLAQEELLGLAIERLKLSAVNVQQTLLQQGQQQQQQGSGELQQGSGNAAAAGAGSGEQQQQQGEELPYARQLQLLQQLVGRQLSDARVVFAVHNYGYQGIFKGRHHFDRLGLPGRMLSAFVSPLARAAAKAGAAASAAAGAAVSAVSSQLAALAGVLQQLTPEAPSDTAASAAAGTGSSGSNGLAAGLAVGSSGAEGVPGLGLFSSLQSMLRQQELGATAAALVQAEAAAVQEQQDGGPAGPQQQQQQQGGGVQPVPAGVGSAEPHAELLQGLQDVLAAAATHTGWEPPQENRHTQDQQQQVASSSSSSGAPRAASPSSAGDSSRESAVDAAVDVNWLRAGLAASDLLVTVSEGYAEELLQGRDPSGATNPELQALLAAKGLTGVLNGLDTAFWDPARDPLLPSAVRYSLDTAGAGKAAAKQLVQRRLGLAEDAAAPLFVFVGRLSQQKGVDVILAALPQLMHQQAGTGRAQWAQWAQQQEPGAPGPAAVHSSFACSDSSSSSSEPGGVSVLQVALLGNGERWMEDVLGQLDGRYPGRAVGVPAFNEPLAHLLMAAADYILVPSRFEPCGLVALAALRYGVVPLGTATGGLGDVVKPCVGYTLLSPGPEGDTAAFRRAVGCLVDTVQQAAGDYGSADFEARRAAAMALDVSWEQPANAWEQLLLQLAQGGDKAQGPDTSSAASSSSSKAPPDCQQQPQQQSAVGGGTAGVGLEPSQAGADAGQGMHGPVLAVPPH